MLWFFIYPHDLGTISKESLVMTETAELPVTDLVSIVSQITMGALYPSRPCQFCERNADEVIADYLGSRIEEPRIHCAS